MFTEAHTSRWLCTRWAIASEAQLLPSDDTRQATKKKGEDAAEGTAVAEPEAAHATAVADAIAAEPASGSASASAVADASDPNGDDYVGSNVCRYPALSGAAERLKTHRYA